jgi:zinc protease
MYLQGARRPGGVAHDGASILASFGATPPRMRRWSLLLLLVLSACGSAPPTATTPPVSTAPTAAPPAVDELDQPLALDARITKGTLDNGLTYYVLPHRKPEKRAQIWLAVNAGAVLEDDDQRGLAHFVEHMGFNGTRRFPKQQLVDFLEQSGVRFGPDLNAYTSFDETVYKLQVPTDKPELVERAIAILRDWADGIRFDPEEVDKERGVVLEEWRLGRGAAMRIFDRQTPVLFHGSKYAERLPIGKPEIIRTASRDTLVRFYEDWYRPDLMAVAAVGDFSAAEVEAQIRSEFGSLESPSKPRPRPIVTLPVHAQTLVSIETDPEMPATSVSILSKLPHRPEASARDYRRSITEQLFNAMLNARLDEIRRQPDAPFLAASSSSSGLVRTADAFRQSARVKQDAVERGFGALLEEVLRVERHGFAASELDRAKAQLLRFFQQAVKELDKTDSRELVAEIVRNFFEHEAMPGRKAELSLVERFLPTIEVAELNALGKSLARGSRVILVTGPDQMARPSQEALLGIERAVAARSVAAYEDKSPGQPFMGKLPKRGKIAKRSSIPELGVTEWTLDNRVRVIVKPTDFDNDVVRMSAFSPGGSSLVKDADYVSAKFADEVVSQGGLGPFDAVELRKALAGKVVSVSARIAELEERLSGRASPADLETMFQMIHLSFTSARRDDQAFSAWRARETENVRNRRLSPETSFFEDMLVFQTQNHPRRRPTTPELLQQIDLEKALAIYADRFADASDFSFVLVGNLELDELEALVETYLGSLPTKPRKESWRDVQVRWPNGIRTKTVHKGSEPKSRVTLTFHGRQKWSRDAENDLRMLTEALRFRLRQILREDMGGVYGVQVSGSISRRPRQEYRLQIGFGCSPDSVEKLKQAVFDELQTIQRDGVKEEYVHKIRQARRRAHEVDLRDNGFWLRELERAYTYGDDPRLIPEIEPLVAKVSADRIRAAARTYASPRQYVLGVLEPASGTSAPASTADAGPK